MDKYIGIFYVFLRLVQIAATKRDEIYADYYLRL